MKRKEWSVRTGGRGLTDLTARIAAFVRESGVQQGLCNVFLVHTSASLILGENADPSVRKDLETFFARVVPDGDAAYEHDTEGPDDMPSHIRTVLTQNSLAPGRQFIYGSIARSRTNAVSSLRSGDPWQLRP